MTIRDPNEQKDIEKAIIFLVKNITKSCRNTKPVILHSLRVGLKLMDMNQPKEVVEAGFLHDLLEDTDCPIEEIKSSFGDRVTDLVTTLTFDANIKDYKARWHKAMDIIEKAGKDAMIIKLIDQMDNLPYYMLISDETKKQEVLWKHHLVIERFEKYFPGDKLFTNYKQMVKNTV